MAIIARSIPASLPWQIQSLLLLGIVFCGSGAACNRSFRNPFAPMGPPAPEVLLTGSSLDHVIAAVNQNASRVVSYQTNNASITVPGMPMIPLLRGNIAARVPGKVRLQASTALTGAEVDLGSNDELFWFWVKRNEPPALYFSRHDQFADSAARQIMPIEPQWLLDALGMMQFSPNDRHEGPFPQGDKTLEVSSIIQTAGGQMSKTTLIDARRAWVLEQHVYDAAGTLVASTRAKGHRYYPSICASLPQEIELRLPAAQLALSINVGTLQLNVMPENPALWSLPVLSGYPQIDLGTASPGSVAPMGSAGSKDWNTFASPAFVGISPQSIAAAPTIRTAVLPTGSDHTPVDRTAAVLPPPTFTPTLSASHPQGQGRQGHVQHEVVQQGETQHAQPLHHPITQQLRPGGVAIPREAR